MKISSDAQWIITLHKPMNHSHPQKNAIVVPPDLPSAAIHAAASGTEVWTKSSENGAYYSDGDYVMEEADKKLTVWQTSNQQLVAQLKATNFYSVAISAFRMVPSMHRLLVAGWSSPSPGGPKVDVWNTVTGQLMARINGTFDSYWIGSLQWAESIHPNHISGNGRRFLVLDAKIVSLYDCLTGRQLGQLGGHNGRVTSAALSPDGQRVLTGSEDRTARLWDANTCRELLTFPCRAEVEATVFSPDGRRLLIVSKGEGLILDASDEMNGDAVNPQRNTRLASSPRR